jgi:hypothetical protein
MTHVDRFETKMDLLPGMKVRARIVSQQPWGVFAQIIGYEDVPASIDVLAQFGAAMADSMFPEVGAEVDAVVTSAEGWDGHTRARLSIRPADLENFTRICNFCWTPVSLNPGDGGLVLNVGTNDGPGSFE